MAVQVEIESGVLKDRGEVLDVGLVDGMMSDNNSPIAIRDALHGALKPIKLGSTILGDNVGMEFARAFEVVIRVAGKARNEETTTHSELKSRRARG